MTSHLEDGQLTLFGAAPRTCEWCAAPLPAAAPASQRSCSQSCRQARHRFRVAPAGTAAARPMTFAYADPPYPGKAEKYYADDPRCAEVDHAELIARLERDFPAGWALSTSEEALQDVLALCPRGVKTAPWIRGARRGTGAKAARRVPNAWEPLIVCRGRPQSVGVAEDLVDVLIWGGRQHTHPGALPGMKPAAFWEWMFRQLGAAAGDTFVDLYPGSGAGARAWALYAREAGAAGLPSRLAEAAARVPEAG